MKFEKKYTVGIDWADKKLRMTNRAIVTILQNTASFFSDSVGYGIFDIPKTLLLWFVVDWKVEIIKRPQYGDEITVKTWGRDASRSFLYSDFEIYVGDELCVKATSKWVLLSAKTKTFENISKELAKLYEQDEAPVFGERELAHMNILDQYDEKNKIIIRKSDLDFNNHINNVKYFDYLIDYAGAREFDNFRITYRKEIKENDEVYLCHSEVNEKNYYAILDENGAVKTIIECW